MHALIICIFVVLLVAACATNTPVNHCAQKRDFLEAHSELKQKRYKNAINILENIRSCAPTNKYAPAAMIDLIYAYIHDGQADLAHSLANTFIKLHPQHEYLDYVLYMRGLYYFYQDQSLARYFSQDMSERNTANMRQSYNNLLELLDLFPNSMYAFDARQRVIYLRELLAKSVINVAFFYLKREAYVAAANRANYLLENYPRSSFVVDALKIMVQSYSSMQLYDLADRANKVLNFKNK